MRLVVDISDNSVASFMKIVKSHSFIKDVKELKDKRKSRLAKGIAESFKEVRLYEEGKKDLKNAKDLIDELRSKSH